MSHADTDRVVAVCLTCGCGHETWVRDPAGKLRVRLAHSGYQCEGCGRVLATGARHDAPDGGEREG